MYETLFFSALLHLLSEEEKHERFPCMLTPWWGGNTCKFYSDILCLTDWNIYTAHLYTSPQGEGGGENPDRYKFILRFSSPRKLVFSPIPTSTANHSCVLRKGIGLPQSKFPHSCDWAIYVFPRSVHLVSCSRIGRPIRGIPYINRSQKHECRSWDCSRAVPFLGIFVSNFRYCVFAVFTPP
jgi:hypothetical protein